MSEPVQVTQIRAWLDDNAFGHDLFSMGTEFGAALIEEYDRMRHKLFEVAVAISDPDRDHVDRCVAVSRIVGSAEVWRS